MTSRIIRSMWVFGSVCVVSVSGCTCGQNALLDTWPPATFASDAEVHSWAAASAPSLYSTVLLAASSESDAGCPKVTDDGTTMSTTGGCTDSQGVRWEGSATFARSAPDAQSGVYTYREFSRDYATPCSDGGTEHSSQKFDGTMKISGNDSAFNFDLNLQIDAKNLETACSGSNVTAAYAYQGQGSKSGNTTKWNGSGRVGTSRYGVAQVETKDEVIDALKCATEAASGTTTARAGGNVMVVTYDGESKCDRDSKVTWTLNGAAQGELEGVACTSAPSLSAWALVALAWRLVRRRESKGQ